MPAPHPPTSSAGCWKPPRPLAPTRRRARGSRKSSPRYSPALPVVASFHFLRLELVPALQLRQQEVFDFSDSALVRAQLLRRQPVVLRLAHLRVQRLRSEEHTSELQSR